MTNVALTFFSQTGWGPTDDGCSPSQNPGKVSADLRNLCPLLHPQVVPQWAGWRRVMKSQKRYGCLGEWRWGPLGAWVDGA